MVDTQGSQRERGRAAGDGSGCDGQHPAWCSPEHCLVTDDSVRVHAQAPVRWEDHEAEVVFESRLLDPADEEDTYLELSLKNLQLTWFHYLGILPLDVVRRLRDQLTEHLDAVALPGEPPTVRPADEPPGPAGRRFEQRCTAPGGPTRSPARAGRRPGQLRR